MSTTETPAEAPKPKFQAEFGGKDITPRPENLSTGSTSNVSASYDFRAPQPMTMNVEFTEGKKIEKQIEKETREPLLIIIQGKIEDTLRSIGFNPTSDRAINDVLYNVKTVISLLGDVQKRGVVLSSGTRDYADRLNFLINGKSVGQEVAENLKKFGISLAKDYQSLPKKTASIDEIKPSKAELPIPQAELKPTRENKRIILDMMRVANSCYADFESVYENTSITREQKNKDLEDFFDALIVKASHIISQNLPIREDTKNYFLKFREADILTRFYKNGALVLSSEFMDAVGVFIRSLNDDSIAFFNKSRGEPEHNTFKEQDSSPPIDSIVDTDNQDFKRFFLQFDKAHNKDAPFEKVPMAEAERRLEDAREAFDLVQKAIVIFARFAKDRIQQGLGRAPEAADFLAANFEIERMAFRNVHTVGLMIEKMEMFIMPSGPEKSSSAPSIEEDIARLENKIMDELPEDQLLKIQDELFVDHTKLENEHAKLRATSEDHKTRYGLTINEAAHRLGQARLETKAFNEQLKETTAGLREVAAQYERIRQRIVDLKTAQQEKQKLESQFAELKAEVIKNSKIFAMVASEAAQRVNEDIGRYLWHHPTLGDFAGVRDKVRDLERAAGSVDYINVPEVGKEYSLAAHGLVPTRYHLVEKFYRELEKEVNGSVQRASIDPAFESGFIGGLQRILTAYGDRGRAIINTVLDKQIKTNAGVIGNKAMMLTVLKIRLNKKS